MSSLFDVNKSRILFMVSQLKAKIGYLYQK